MRSQGALSELVGLIYDAAGDAARWSTFLQSLGRELKSTGNNIFVQDLRSQEFSVAAAIGMDPFYQGTYEDHFKSRNVYLIQGNHLLQTGKAYPS